MKKVLTWIFALTMAGACGMMAACDNTTSVPSHAHTYDLGVVTTEAGCTSEGVLTYSCTVNGCHEKYTEPLKATGHKWEGIGCKNGCGTTLQVSEGLEFKKNMIGYEKYYVSGLGTCRDEDLYLPSEYNGLPVEGVAEYAFSSKMNIRSVTMPDSILVVEEKAFYSCANLQQVQFSQNLTEIGDYAFAECAFEELWFPDSVERIGACAFAYNYHLMFVRLGKNLKNFGGSGESDLTFLYCMKLFEVWNQTEAKTFAGITPGNTMTVYGGVARNARVVHRTSVETKFKLYENGVITYPEFTLNTSNYPTFTNSGNEFVLAYVGNGDKVSVPQGVTKLLPRAFYSKTITEVELPEGLTAIGDSAFIMCSTLQKINVPASVTTIGYDAFWRCEALAEVTFAQPSGWKYSKRQDMSNAEDIAEECLTSSGTAAEMLREYCYYWVRA